jgi:uncharacterized protein (TIGR03086 family)
MLDLLDESLEYAATVVAGIKPDQSEVSTPCPDFTVDHLVEHLVNGFAWYAGLPAGGNPDPTDVRGPDAHEVGYVAALSSVIADVRANWSAPQLAATYAMPFGSVPGIEITRFQLLEALVHAWDLAVATGQAVRPADDLAERILAEAQSLDEDTLRSPGMLGAPVAVASSAPPMDQLVAFTGRQPTG